MSSALQVAVIGAGAFGQNHIRVYQQLEQDGHPVHLAAIVDPLLADPAHAAALLAKTAHSTVQAPAFFTTLEACLAAGTAPLHAASICTPTSSHAAAATMALNAGLHLLVEKPIARTVSEADRLITQAAAVDRILQVGHLERFNPAVQAFLPHLNQPMFFEAHRLSIFTPRSLDVDVVLDLMIHDLDIVLTFAKSQVREIRAVGLPILSAKTDIANVRIEFESGCVANFTASRVSTERVRKLRFFQPHQYVSLDYARQEILLIETGGLPTPAIVTDTVSSAAALPGLNISKPPVTPGEPLRLELESFLHSIRTGTAPVVPGEQGRAALALALDITTAIEAHLARTGL